jgi:hypothetical protein
VAIRPKHPNPKHPLDRLLPKYGEDDFSIGYETSLKSMARQVAHGAEQAVIDAFFKESLLKRLRTNKYAYVVAVDPKARRKPQTTFYETLQNAGVLDRLLLLSNLTELLKWILLEGVLREEQTRRMNHHSPQGFPLKFHRAFHTELLRHANEVQAIAQKYNAVRALRGYGWLVSKEFRRQFQIIAASQRPESWKMLLQETGRDEPEHKDDALKLRIYAFLKAKLQTTTSLKLGISDSFLRQLTLVVRARPTGEEALLRHSAALYQHIKRRYKPR